MKIHPRPLPPLTHGFGSTADLARFCAVVQMALATLALGGWYANLPWLASLHPRYLPMPPGPAVAFLVTGVALLVAGAAAHSGLARRIVAALGIVVGIYGLGRLIEAEPGTSSLVSVNFALAGLALTLLALSRGNDTLADCAGALAAVCAGAQLPIVLAALHGTPLFHGSSQVPLRVSLALASLCLNVSLVAIAGPERFPLRHFVGHSSRARLLRAFLPVSVVSVFVHGLVHQMVPDSLELNAAFLSAISVAVSTAITATVVLYVAKIIGGEMDRYEEQRRQHEAALADHRRKLIESAKLSALGEMAAGIAHEINTPLLVINGRSHMLKEAADTGTLDRAVVAEDAAKILDTAKRIAKIVSGLKSVSRNAATDPFAKTSVAALLEDVLELSRERFHTAGVELGIPRATHGIEVECRASEVVQVLLNLLNNAFDAVVDRTEKWVAIDVASRDGAVEFAVTDSGPGIPDAVRQNLMQAFFTTKAVGKGTGLGLSISKAIIERHGGELKLDLESPRTRFIVRLPLVQPEPEKATPESAASLIADASKAA